MWRWIVLLVVVLGLVAGIAAGVLNPHVLTLDLFFVQIEAALGALIISAFVCGSVVGGLFALLFGVARRSRPTVSTANTDPGKDPSLLHD